jgi:hypothetical protein
MRQCFQSEAAASQAVISTAAVLVKDRTGGIVENSLMIVGALKVGEGTLRMAVD